MGTGYFSGAEKKPVWLILPPNEICENTPFYPYEVGKCEADDDWDSFNCGKSDYILLNTYKGSGELHCRQHIYPLHENSLVLLDASQPYRMKRIPYDGGWCFNWLRFNGRSFEYYRSAIAKDGTLVLPVSAEDRITEIFDEIIRLFTIPGQEASFELSHLTETILIRMLKLTASASSKKKRHRETISKATEYIRHNYSTPLDIDLLAKQAGLSKFYFIKLFKDFMDIAPYEYVIVYRISEAKKYLRASQLKVSEISAAVGFNDECNFIRTFKRITGITPLQYREKER